MGAHDPLSAVPVAANGTSLSALPEGGALLTRRGADAPGLGGWLARKLGFRRERSYELDELGVCYWTHIDGQRSLSEIERALCGRFALAPEQARRAVVEFTAVLMRRHLLGLRVENR